jgi:hypothetical protein
MMPIRRLLKGEEQAELDDSVIICIGYSIYCNLLKKQSCFKCNII